MAAVILQPVGRSLARPAQPMSTRATSNSCPDHGEVESLAVVIPFPGTIQPQSPTRAIPTLEPQGAKQAATTTRPLSQSSTQLAASSTVQPGKLQLTTRGWIVLSLIGLIAAIAIGTALGGMFEPQLFDLSTTQTITVQSGDTLWSIASGIALPQHDVRDVIEVIKDLNGMTHSSLVDGQQIVLPSVMQ